MPIIADVNRLISLIIDTFKQMGRGTIWLILLAYLLLQWLVLYAHYDFSSPLFAGMMNGWVTLVNNDRAVPFTHYPSHVLLLPYYFGWARFFVGMLVEGTVLGLVAVLFANSYRRPAPADRLLLSVTLKRWLQFVFGWLLLNGVLLLVNFVLPDLFAPLITGSPRRELAFELGLLPLIYCVVLSFCFLIVPSIAVFGDNILQAIGRSVRVWRRRPVAIFVLSTIILVVPVLISAAVGRADVLVDKFKPDLVYWLLVIGIGADFFINFFWMGSAVGLLIDEEM